MFDWLFGNETERKANDIASSPFWDGGSSKEILKTLTPEQIDKLHEKIEEEEDFIDCMLF